MLISDQIPAFPTPTPTEKPDSNFTNGTHTAAIVMGVVIVLIIAVIGLIVVLEKQKRISIKTAMIDKVNNGFTHARFTNHGSTASEIDLDVKPYGKTEDI